MVKKAKGLTKFQIKRIGSHRAVLAFPPGVRHRGMGQVSAILHPKTEKQVARSMRRYGRKMYLNPRAVKVYDRIMEVVARKGPGHKCDAACLRANHTYVHKFKEKAGIYGLPDGSLLVK